MAQLNDSIQTLKGIGGKKAQAFEKLGVYSLYDLISFFPRRYEDRTATKSIGLTSAGESCCIQAVIADEPRLTRIRKGLDLVKFRIADETGTANVTFFNQSWLKNTFSRGDEYVFYGKIDVSGRSRSLTNPVFEKADAENSVTGQILPVYPLTAGLNQKTVLQCIRQGLESCGELIPEVIPPEILERQKLARAGFSYRNIHLPSSFEALDIARRRLIFEELFLLSCALGSMQKDRMQKLGMQITCTDPEPFYAALPFSPTGAQKRAVQDALRDMQSGTAMNRLVQGDVGSGKTLVAAALCYIMKQNGRMSAFMAPTEILAEQHYHTLSSLLSPFGIVCEKLTGSMSAKEKRELKSKLASGEIDLIIGTHALFTEGTEYPNLGLVITDEQHRFGVAQRAALVSKGDDPHILVMSATPIPRTLALIIYGDLDVSILDEMPPGRKPVATFTVDESYRERLNGFIRKQHAEGHQIFIVCPKVEEEEDSEVPSDLKSAEEHAKVLQEQLPELKIGCVHGRMKPKEKDEIMSRFAAGEIDVLVSTTVIEVGVDVPNATLMIVENAERFGLSQLHQLRGRVGRGDSKSWCILVSDTDNEDSRARLNIMCQTNDGFKISEEDLRLRGPGDFFGSRQHGLPEMHLANLGADTRVLEAAKEEANALLAADPDLSKPEHKELKQRMEAMFADSRYNA